MTSSFYELMTVLCFCLLITPVIYAFIVTMACRIWAYVDDSELRIPNHLLKISVIDIGDGANTFSEVLCNILFFALAVMLSSFAAFVWPVVLPIFIIVILMKITRGLRRMVKKD